MEIYIEQQLQSFLCSILLGAGMGISYDLLRITRASFHAPLWLWNLGDVLFSFFSAVITFGYLLQTTRGTLRFFLLMGIAIGATLYFFTCSPYLYRFSVCAICRAKKILMCISKFILRPILYLYHQMKNIYEKLRNRHNSA